MKKHQCKCMGVDDKTPCEEPMTQEDLLCDHCRNACFTPDAEREKAWWRARRAGKLM